MKTFYAFLANNLVASVVNFTVWFAIIFYAYLQTQSVLVTSVMSGIYLIMVALSGFWLGSFVDHYPKRLVFIISSLFSLTCYVVSFGLYLAVGDAGLTQVSSPALWMMIVLILVGVIAGNVRNIAIPTLVTILVPEDRRDKVNGLVGTVSGISFLITSVISGLLVGSSGMWGVFVLATTLTLGCLLHAVVTPVNEVVQSHDSEEPKKLDIPGTLAAIRQVPGFPALIIFTMFNNFLGGVFMSLMDAYGLSLVSVQIWGILWGFLSTAFILGGLIITKFGLGKNPLRALFLANIIIWTICCVFTVKPWIGLLVVGMFTYLCVVPYIEAAEQTVIQKVIDPKRQGRVFGFAQSVEQAASPLMALMIGPITQFVMIPFMTEGLGAQVIGPWFGTGMSRGIAMVFTLTGFAGLTLTLIAFRSKYYHQLSAYYLKK